MSNVSAIHGQPDIAAYSASKFYVAGLTEALGPGWRGDGIRVLGIWPLWAKTPLADVAWEAVRPRNRWARGHVHSGVFRLDRALYLGRSLAPDRVARPLTRVMTG